VSAPLGEALELAAEAPEGTRKGEDCGRRPPLPRRATLGDHERRKSVGFKAEAELAEARIFGSSDLGSADG
jgi:hypothetical protein